jgi:integrase
VTRLGSRRGQWCDPNLCLRSIRTSEGGSGTSRLAVFVFGATNSPLGLPHLRWHDLRHVAASVLIADEASADDVSRVLGHANAAITQMIYSHEFEKTKRAERMERAFGEVLG